MADAAPLLSTILTDMAANPVVKHDPWEDGGKVREKVGYLAVTSAQATAAATGDTWRFVRLPSNARLSYVKLYAKGGIDSSTGFTFNLGILPSAGGSGTTGYSNILGSALTVFQSSAAVQGTDYLATTVTADLLDQQLWGLAGASSDPGGTYDIGITVGHAVTTAAAGDIAVVVGYVLQ